MLYRLVSGYQLLQTDMLVLTLLSDHIIEACIVVHVAVLAFITNTWFHGPHSTTTRQYGHVTSTKHYHDL